MRGPARSATPEPFLCGRPDREPADHGPRARRCLRHAAADDHGIDPLVRRLVGEICSEKDVTETVVVEQGLDLAGEELAMGERDFPGLAALFRLEQPADQWVDSMVVSC